jgi:hypothetical protein
VSHFLPHGNQTTQVTMPKKKKSLLKKKSLKAKRESSTKELGYGHTRTNSGGGTLRKEVSLHRSSVPSSVPSSVESGRDSWASEEIRRKTDGMGLTCPQSSEEKKRKRVRKRRIKRVNAVTESSDSSSDL